MRNEILPIVRTGVHLNEARESFPCVLIFLSVLLTDQVDLQIARCADIPVLRLDVDPVLEQRARPRRAI